MSINTIEYPNIEDTGLSNKKELEATNSMLISNENYNDLMDYQALYIAYVVNDNSIYIPTSIYEEYLTSKYEERPDEKNIDGIDYILVTKDDIDLISKISVSPNLKPDYRKLDNDYTEFNTNNMNEIIMDFPDIKNYPKLSDNTIWDGKKHKIIPSGLSNFYIENQEFYIMIYKDLNLNIDSIALLGKNKLEDIVNIPLDNYNLLNDLMTKVKLKPVDKNILPNHIHCNELVEIKRLINNATMDIIKKERLSEKNQLEDLKKVIKNLKEELKEKSDAYEIALNIIMSQNNINKKEATKLIESKKRDKQEDFGEMTLDEFKVMIKKLYPDYSIGMHGTGSKSKDLEDLDKTKESIMGNGLYLTTDTESGFKRFIQPFGLIKDLDNNRMEELCNYSYGYSVTDGKIYKSINIVLAFPQTMSKSEIEYYIGYLSYTENLPKDLYENPKLIEIFDKIIPKEFILGYFETIYNDETKENKRIFYKNSHFYGDLTKEEKTIIDDGLLSKIELSSKEAITEENYYSIKSIVEKVPIFEKYYKHFIEYFEYKKYSDTKGNNYYKF